MDNNQVENEHLIEKVWCSGCGAFIGEVVEFKGHEMLSVSGILVTILRGVCECGEEFHWSISERTLARLINNAKKC